MVVCFFLELTKSYEVVYTIVATMAKKNSIFIRGARSNNLKNVDLEIPYNQLIVVTGVSGSGKSSLTMDTLYAEGQRRYVESLSSYARQFLMRMKKPDVDNIEGLCPAIAIEQRVGAKNARSTVGTLTEIYDYMRLLFARVGRTFSPVSNTEVKKCAVSDVVDYIFSLPQGTRILLYAPLMSGKRQSLPQWLDFLLQKGFTRLRWQDKLEKIESLLEQITEKTEKPETIDVLIDRFAVTQGDTDLAKRIADSVQLAFQEGQGVCLIQTENGDFQPFSNRFEKDGIIFEEPTPQLFNFNSSYGACPVCEGYGKTMGIDPEKVVPDYHKSVFEDAIVCWRGEKLSKWKEDFLQIAHKYNFPVHRSYKDLNEQEKDLLWNGTKEFSGIYGFFKELEDNSYKIQNRVMLARYRGKTDCHSCKGSRLRKEALYIRVADHNVAQLVKMSVEDLHAFFVNIQLSESDFKIARRLVLEITTRLQFMLDVGLGYLTIDRLSATLSGGETQRIHLTRTLGSNLTSSLYILDEPSIGLHPRDTARLVRVLKNLRDMGNTVVVVEHEEDIIKNADFLVDVGPKAGIHGGHIVFSGHYSKIFDKAADSLTTLYMNGGMKIDIPALRRKYTYSLQIKGARQNNLKTIDVTIPLNVLSVVTGVSGSGKTTLVKQILYPFLSQKFDDTNKEPIGSHDSIEGDLNQLTAVEMVNQHPIGKSSRSNPVTYVKAYDAIRKLFSDQAQAKMQGFKPKHFSFNVEGGRCETCKGEGEITVSMQFLADVNLTCEECNGKRFLPEILEIEYKEKTIYDVLEMTVDEAMDFFKDHSDVTSKLKPLQDVGLGYVKLGQSSSTLSGGEAQRVKLAYFLSKERGEDHIFFIFDEPTTGLHFHDIRKLLDALNALVEAGHTVLVVEHNLDVIKCADYVIDLGKEGGMEGGHLLFQGTPEGLLQCTESYTAEHLKEKF